MSAHSVRRTASGLLATIAWLGALLAVFGAALLNATLMGVSGLVSAVAALVWGIAKAVTRGERADDSSCPVCDHPFGDMGHACIGADRVRYTPVDRGRMVP